jgi:hypothetical protein
VRYSRKTLITENLAKEITMKQYQGRVGWIVISAMFVLACLPACEHLNLIGSGGESNFGDTDQNLNNNPTSEFESDSETLSENGPVSQDELRDLNNPQWTLVASPADFPPRSSHAGVVYDGRMWIMGGMKDGGGELSDVWWSKDGETWFEATSNAAWGPRELMGRHCFPR